MTQVVVPVRYPLTPQSRATLSAAVEVAREEDAALSVLHVDLYQNGSTVTRRDLKAAVGDAVDGLSTVSFVVRKGLLVEETILEEVAEQDADVVVIGKKQAGRWRQMVRRLMDDPDVEEFLQAELDCRVVTVTPD